MKNSTIYVRGVVCILAISVFLTACGGGSSNPPKAFVRAASSSVATSNTGGNPLPPSSSSQQQSMAASSIAVVPSSSWSSSLSTASSIFIDSGSSSLPAIDLSSSSSSISQAESSSLESSLSPSSVSSLSSSSLASSSLTIAPAQPQNLTSLRQAGVGVNLSWEDMADNETAYIVKRAASDAPDTWVTLEDTLPANTTSYIDKSIVSVEADTYSYQIFAANQQTLSEPLVSPAINLIGYQHPKSESLMPVMPETWANATWKLGGHFNGTDWEVGVYSKNAERILLEVYSHKHLAAAQSDTKAARARQDYWLVKGPDNIWRGKLAKLPEGGLYGFRAWGPNWTWSESWHRGNATDGFISDVSRTGPANLASSYTGHRFNPNKLLSDPYAYELSHDTGSMELWAAKETDAIYGTGGADLVPLVAASTAADFQYSGPITNNTAMDRRNIDTAIWAPKSVALHVQPYTAVKPNIPQQNAIEMEAHLRGLTQHPSTGQLRSLLTNYQSWFDNFDEMQNIPEEYRGTYKGAGMMAPYLKALGINVIEFMPVQETRNETNDLTPTKANFWGYMTYGFFAPDRFYASDKTAGGPTREFRAMVEAFNQQGIEVWLDVVYNHTGEGGNWGNPFVTGFNSFGGLDAAEYYHLNPFDKRYLEAGATGTGNQLNFSRDTNHNLVLDSMAYWIDYMGISGFRFDLAPVLGRDPDAAEGKAASEYWNAVKAFNPNHRTLLAIRDLAMDRNIKITAESWDIWGYQVGNFASGWAEWNGRFRDAARKYLQGDPSGEGGASINDVFHGDYNHFNDNGGPQKSVNFLVAHDGFTLADMVSYSSNLSSMIHTPFGPSDGGSDNNLSWDSSGSAKPVNLTLEQFRRQRLRNFWTLQFFSRGVPMIVYGDEFGRTQNGNNNPYNIDSPATWNNYAMLATNSPHTVAVHPDYPATNYHNNLGVADNLDPSVNPLLIFSREIMQRRKGDVALRQANYTMPIHYASETGGSLASYARARRMHLAGSTVGGSDYLLFMNMWTAQINFTFPAPPPGKQWVRIIDTANWAEKETMNIWSDASGWRATAAPYGVHAWSIAVFKAI